MVPAYNVYKIYLYLILNKIEKYCNKNNFNCCLFMFCFTDIFVNNNWEDSNKRKFATMYLHLNILLFELPDDNNN
jgi:hypothetical protein